MSMNKIYLYDYLTVIISKSLNTGVHSHLAHQLTLSLDNKAINVEVDGVVNNVNFIYVPSLTKHKFIDLEGSYLTILIDNESAFKPENLESVINGNQSTFSSIEEIEVLLKGMNLLKGKIFDERIEQSLNLVCTSKELGDIRANDICKIVGLSESRFLHLFKEQVGVPFRKYILWKKLKNAIGLVAKSEGTNLTEIAHEAGFSDSAHLSKVIKSSFGLSPTEIMKNSQFIQV
jgi:AraC-like DNA-binding protein